MPKFSGQLASYIKNAGLPLRRVASLSGIPHQTLFNWLKGTQPRWHAALSGDLHRLGTVLGLTDEEVAYLLRLARCVPAHPRLHEFQEDPMKETFRIPKGWEASGEAPYKYEMGLDPEATYEDHPCVTIKSGPDPSEFAALCQTFKADTYRGKRLRFSAVVRSVDVENCAALFMRVDGPSEKMLAFDNMRNRQISGTNDWTQYAVVLDVAEEAEKIVFGVFLSLNGQIWMSGVRLDVVSPDVPTTDIMEDLFSLPDSPANLEFEE